MASILAPHVSARQRVLPEKAGHHVKARLRNPEMECDEDFRALIGRAIQRAVAIVGWSNKEAAATVGVDDSQFGKWLSGAERPHFDKLFAVEQLRGPLVMALAASTDGAVLELRTAI